MNKLNILKDFNGKTSELSEVINSWNLISDSSKSDFDRLSQKILSNIYDEMTGLKIKRILESELCVTFGLYATEFDAEKLTNEIMTWWNEKS